MAKRLAYSIQSLQCGSWVDVLLAMEEELDVAVLRWYLWASSREQEMPV
jgi:hypothetical protein